MAPRVESYSEKVKRLARGLDLSAPEMQDEQVPFDVYKELRETDPVKWTGKMGGRTGQRQAGSWFVTRYQDLAAIFRDDESFTSTQFTAGGVPGPVPKEHVAFEDIDPLIVAMQSQKIPIGLDPPDFFTYRPLLNPLFSPAKAKSLDVQSREIANHLLDEVVDGGRIDVYSQFAKPLPAILTCRILGLPEEDWQIYAVSHVETAGYAGGRDASPGEIIARVVPSVESQMAMLSLANQRRKDPQDDVITAVAHMKVNGELLNFYELGAITSVLLSGGLHTTTLAIESAVAYLGRNTHLQRWLIDDPARIRTFAEEVLRMWPPIHTFFRNAKRDVVIGDKLIKEGDPVLLCIASANRDASEFPNPDEFIADRQPNRHITFAVGIHRCLGSSLARVMLTTAIEEMLKRMPGFVIEEESTKIPPMVDTGSSHFQGRALVATFRGAVK
jgi:cytochrome P450